MNLEVYRRDGHHNACHSTNGEGYHKAESPKHGCGKCDSASEHCKKPVEDFNAGWNGDNHGCDSKEGVRFLSAIPK